MSTEGAIMAVAVGVFLGVLIAWALSGPVLG
jgi:hypothetical protein